MSEHEMPFNLLLNAQSREEWDDNWTTLVSNSNEFAKGPTQTLSINTSFMNYPPESGLNDEINAESPYFSYQMYEQTRSPVSNDSPYPRSPLIRSNSMSEALSSESYKSSQIPQSPSTPKSAAPPNAFKKVNHNGKKMFECSWSNCQKRFTRLATNANAHWHRHGQLKSFYVCQLCSMGFERMCDMRRHLNSSHN